MRIGERRIGPGEPAYLIAELSGNHQQSLDRALRLVEAAHRAGADAVKLQTYTADTLTLDSDKEYFRIQGTLWDGQRLHDLYRQACTPWEWTTRLQELAASLGMHCFSSPFDPTAVDFLEGLQVPAYKIASFELVDHGLIQKVAGTGKPTIMSTGMGTLGEIEAAVAAFRQAGGGELALLKCTSAYPADPAEMNLRTIPHLGAAFNLPVGLSDHSLGHSVAVAAVALGACIVEKHLTLARSDGGPDGAFSLEPDEFRSLVESIRMAERALGQVSYRLTAQEEKSRIFRRSLFIARPVRAGEVLTADNVRSVRPAHGLPPRHLPQVVGRRAACDLEPGTPLAWEHLA